MNHRWKQLTAGLLCIAMLTGCGGGLPIASEAKATDSYSLPQSMIIVATERNRYQQVYTDEIWKVTLDDGSSFQSYLLGQVQEFLQNLKTMTLLAQDQDITLTSAEKDQIRRLADAYYEGLTEADIAYMGITPEDVLNLYQEYHLANKVVNELTRELDLEVSDSDAKVITIQQIQLADADTAAEVYAQVTAEDSDFAAIAKAHSTDSQIERQLGRGEASVSLEQAAFALETGQISPVVSSDGSYYIIKCVNDYDEAATLERKTWIYNERKNQVFQQIYNQFQVDHDLAFSDEIWQNITFSTGDQSTTTNFFQLYHKEFSSQGY